MHTFLRQPRGTAEVSLQDPGLIWHWRLYSSSCERISVRITMDNQYVASVVVVYRSPSSSAEAFLYNFAIMCEGHFMARNILVMGHLNFHMDMTTDCSAKKLTSLLESMDLREQCITSATPHRHTLTLDLLISRDSEYPAVEGTAHMSPGDFISNHCVPGQLLCSAFPPKSLRKFSL